MIARRDLRALVVADLDPWLGDVVAEKSKNPEAQEYYRVSPKRRVIAGVAYVLLAALLSVAMAGSHIEKQI